MQNGLVEGAPLSVFLVGMALTYFLDRLRLHPSYSELVGELEGDLKQQRIILRERGWIDDWVLFTSSAAAMQDLLMLWEQTLTTLGWHLHPSKTELMAVTCAALPIRFQGQLLEYKDSFEWLGCAISSSGNATSHIRLRSSKAVAASRILVKDFDSSKLAMKVKAKLYKLVIEPTLLHGCVAYGMTRDDWLALEKTQNLIQRTFVKCNLADVHDRWVYIHSKLKTLRSRGDLSDSVLTLKRAFVKATFSKATERILEYRNREW